MPDTKQDPPAKELAIDKLLNAVMVAYDEHALNEALQPVFEEHLSEAIKQERIGVIDEVRGLIEGMKITDNLGAGYFDRADLSVNKALNDLLKALGKLEIGSIE